MAPSLDLNSRPGLIPVVEIESADDAPRLAEALLAGGVSIVEITLRTVAGPAAIAAISERFAEMQVGAGTVLSALDSAKARSAGARFGVAPGLSPQIVESFHVDGLPFLPGVATPTEVGRALELGCHQLKFFPAQAAGGVAYLQALAAPYAHRDIRFCATGGITPDTMLDYLACPNVVAVGGSWLAPRARIAAREWAAITQDCRRAIERIERLAEFA